ncbi:MAG TPA: M1 family aminopeptidase, partial [Gemmataceae bacterium]|nr:M1 family aminopeptidase [Gemmataceae bacterium]
PALPPWLPHYDLAMRLDCAAHKVVVRQRVTWINRHQRPAEELVFNAHSHYTVPESEVGLLAKTLEIMRMMPSDAISTGPPPLQVSKASLGDLDLPFHYREDNNTALVVTLPRPVLQGESVTVTLDYVFELPQKQGRWGQWQGVTFLSNWLPVLAYYDDTGWQPTPFVPWHQPFFNEAGIYHARVILPADQQVACSGSVVCTRPLDGGMKEVEIVAPGVRDFAFLCSAQYQEFVRHVGPIKVRCMALPGHDHYAEYILDTICMALPYYQKWFGPYPWPELTFVESYFGWNGNECATLVMIDSRVFGMPHFAHGYVEYLIAHETCHQWWYNLLGTNGYHETWMDEAFANYFGHRVLNLEHGKNNNLMNYPKGLEWLPNIRRENYRYYELYGTLGRGEATPVVQDMERFGHVITLFSMCYDKGGKILGMIEDRLGEAAFIDFLHVIYRRYQYKIIRVADFQRELEEYTGHSWKDFFDNWLYGTGLTDWSVEKVTLEAQGVGKDGKGWFGSGFLAGLHAGRDDHPACPYRATVLLHQKAAYNEQTVLGVCLDGSKNYQLRIPILPQVPELKLDDPPATVTMLPDNHVRVEVLLPCRPTQITVDPDQVLVDPNPSNNSWHRPIRWRFTPLYTFLEESSLTCDYDRWNVIAGPWVYGQAYEDPWYTRSPMVGLRAGLFYTEFFTGGVYAAYRTDFRDLVVGADGLWDHTPFPTTQLGFNVERRVASLESAEPTNVNRAVGFARYVFQYGDSLYLPPLHFLEVFGDYQDNPLPFERNPLPGAVRYDSAETAGLHYYINYLTPYWDPEGGFQQEATYAGGVVDEPGHQGLHLLHGYLTWVKRMPDLESWAGDAALLGHALRWFGDTRLVLHAYGAGGFPDKGEYFTLGGDTQFRGFDPRQRQGSVIWGTDVEWRVPLAERVTIDCLDHVVGARNIYAALFYDVGDAYAGGRSYGPVAHALGMGLRVDLAYLGMVEHSTLRFDVAKSLVDGTGVQFWFGFTHPF